MIDENVLGSSYRDPSGFIFYKDGELFRQINESYKENYELLVDSGLYQKLSDNKKLISHKEVSLSTAITSDAYKVIKPDLVPFVSYPYEWSFSQLQDAALLTLDIQKEALNCGMSLKDASAFNVQFYKGRPVFIDTLSFERLEDQQPWVAYRQFCQHFFGPLALMSMTDLRLNGLLKTYLDGIPLDLVAALLPMKSRFRLNHFWHIHLHAKLQKHSCTRQIEKVRKNSFKQFTKSSLLAIVESLVAGVGSLKLTNRKTQWAEYYVNATHYSMDSFQKKKEIVSDFLKHIRPNIVWDFGANDGTFSKLAAWEGSETVAFDLDPNCVENNYLEVKNSAESRLLPLLLDVTNPSPSLGWANKERLSLIQRGPADAILALALIHHLAIGNNVPFKRIASFFSYLAQYLVIEFVPKTDPMVKKLLLSRKDIFSSYTLENFEMSFRLYFKILEKIEIGDSGRSLYLLVRSCHS